jgi:putative CRISPR-associated protein (TIGR02620 family)
MNTIIVTRHPTLVQHLIETGVAPADVQVVEHATPENVEGAHVIGVLPIHLAALTARYTNVAVHVPAELRGTELTLEQVRQYAQPPVSYQISIVE